VLHAFDIRSRPSCPVRRPQAIPANLNQIDFKLFIDALTILHRISRPGNPPEAVA
jgi:hypothetical protein